VLQEALEAAAKAALTMRDRRRAVNESFHSRESCPVAMVMGMNFA